MPKHPKDLADLWNMYHDRLGSTMIVSNKEWDSIYNIIGGLVNGHLMLFGKTVVRKYA